MRIKDGGGSSREAKVTENQQLETFSVVEPGDKFNNRFGKTWTINSTSTPVGANDYIFYFKNTGTKTYALTDVRATAAAATLLSLDHVSGTPTFAAGTDLTPVNRNLTSSETIDATIKQDTNTTGLTDLGRLFPIQVESANKLAHLRTTSNILIPPGQAIAIESSALTAVDLTVSITVLDDL